MDSRTDSSQRSIQNLCELFEAIISKPEEYLENAFLLDCLPDQGRMYKYENKELGLISQSLNRVKRNAHIVDGGFDQLEKQRKNAQEAIEKALLKSVTPKPGTKVDLQSKIKTLQTQNQVLQEDMLLLSLLLEKSLHQAQVYANESCSEQIKTLCQKEQKELRAMLTMKQSKHSLNNIIRGCQELLNAKGDTVDA